MFSTRFLYNKYQYTLPNKSFEENCSCDLQILFSCIVNPSKGKMGRKSISLKQTVIIQYEYQNGKGCLGTYVRRSYVLHS